MKIITGNHKSIFFISFVLLFCPVFYLSAQENQSCTKNLELAEEAYFDEEFTEAISLATQCLKTPDLASVLKSQSYKILSKTFLAMENTEKAKEFVNKVLEIEPQYLPTIEQETPKFVNMVIQVRKEREKNIDTENSGLSPWVWIGAGGAVAITTAIVLISNGDKKKNQENNALSLPPDFP